MRLVCERVAAGEARRTSFPYIDGSTEGSPLARQQQFLQRDLTPPRRQDGSEHAPAHRLQLHLAQRGSAQPRSLRGEDGRGWKDSSYETSSFPWLPAVVEKLYSNL